jgi:tetratricopeptide (TPR) repeat protein
MEEKHQQNPRALFLSLSNLNSVGLGYLLTGQKMRWLFSFISNLILLVVAHFTNASKNPKLWAGIFLLVFVGMAVDLWLLLKKKPELIGEKFSRNAMILLLAAVLINLVFYGGFFSYRWAGSNLIKQGDEAYTTSDYESSFKSYYSASQLYRLSLNPAVEAVKSRLNEVSTILAGRDYFAKADYPAAIETIAKFNEFFPDSTKKNDMVVLGIDTYLAWAKDLRGKNEFESSLKQLDIVLDEYAKANPGRISEINNAIASNYLLWGQNLVEKKDFDLGIEKLETVVNQYIESDSYDQAYEDAAKAHYEAALSLIDSKENYELAVSHINTVIDEYSKSTVVDSASLEKPVALLGWGKSLNNEKAYLKALEKYDEIKTITNDTSILAEVDTESQKTIQLLARDVGGDGEVEILFTMQETCAGFPASRPSIDLFPEEQGKALVCDGSDYIVPVELIADMPGTFRYVILREDSSKRIQACPYTGGHTLERWVNTSLITVQLVKNGDVFSKKTFTGAPPSSCPNEYYFSGDTDTSYGDLINDADITTWLGKVLK